MKNLSSKPILGCWINNFQFSIIDELHDELFIFEGFEDFGLVNFKK